jgi:hypothetical protein
MPAEPNRIARLTNGAARTAYNDRGTKVLELRFVGSAECIGSPYRNASATE